jgi:hypothetical protein
MEQQIPAPVVVAVSEFPLTVELLMFMVAPPVLSMPAPEALL